MFCLDNTWVRLFRAGMVRVSVPAPAVAPNMEEVGGVKRIRGRRQRSAHWSDEPFMALSE